MFLWLFVGVQGNDEEGDDLLDSIDYGSLVAAGNEDGEAGAIFNTGALLWNQVLG